MNIFTDIFNRKSQHLHRTQVQASKIQNWVYIITSVKLRMKNPASISALTLTALAR